MTTRKLYRWIAGLMAALTIFATLAPLFNGVVYANGTFSVQTSLSDGSYSIYDLSNTLWGSSQPEQGNQSTDFSLPAGAYSVRFNDVAGHTKPVNDGQVYTLSDMEQKRVFGEYVRIETNQNPVNTIRVKTSLPNDDARYEIKDLSNTLFGVGKGNEYTSFILPVGNYTITFSEVSGYTKPDPIRALVSLDQTNSDYIGIYSQTNSRGELNVKTNLSQGTYTIRDLAGTVWGNGGGTNYATFTLPAGDYIVEFATIVGQTIQPALRQALVTAITPLFIDGNYQPVNTFPRGTLYVSTDNPQGRYEIRTLAGTLYGEGGGMSETPFQLETAAYIIHFLAVAGYTTPGDIQVPLAVNAEEHRTGIYPRTGAATGNIAIEVVKQDNTPILDGRWTLSRCTGATLNTCTQNILSGAAGTPAGSPINTTTGTYGIRAESISGYSGVTIESVNPQELSSNQMITFRIKYTQVTVPTAIIAIRAATQSGSPLTPAVSITRDDTGTVERNGNAPIDDVLIDTTKAYTITFGSLGAGFTTPDPIPIPANSVTVGSMNSVFTGVYTPTEPTRGNVMVTVVKQDNTPFSNGSWTLFRCTGVTISTCTQDGRPGTGGTTTVPNLAAGTYGIVPSATLPAGYSSVEVVGDAVKTLNAGGDIAFTIKYTETTRGSTTGTLIVNATIPQANYTVTRTGMTPLTGSGLTQRFENLEPGVYTVTPGTVAGYVMLAAQTVTLAARDTQTITLTYVALSDITLTKSVVRDANSDTLYRYTITVTNNSTQNTVVVVTDSVTGGSNSISGTNGGKLNYVLNEGNCAPVACEDGNGGARNNINLPGGILLRLDSGRTATITYNMRSDNSGIPTGGSSVLTNTVSARLQDNRTFTAQATVTLNGPTGGGGGGGGGSGPISTGSGGHRLIQGNIGLEVTKMISINGGPFVNARSITQAVLIPRRQTNTAVTYRVSVHNTDSVSIIDATLKHRFKMDGTNLVISPVTNVVGATYNGDKGQFTIDKIVSGGTVEFTYGYNIINKNRRQTSLINWLAPSTYAAEETGAEDILIVESYGTRLAVNEDGLTYNNIGDVISTHFFVGALPAVARGGANNTNTKGASSIGSAESLKVYVVSDKGEARAKENVRFMITLENVGETDLTNLMVTHEFTAQALEITSAGGGSRNHSEITWNRAILRPGEKATYPIDATVKKNAPVGTVRGLTRVILNEFDFSDQIENYLDIVGGAANTSAKAIRLAATGPMGILFYMILMALVANVGYRKVQERRYVYNKRLALSGI